jgi:hypothetical protein
MNHQLFINVLSRSPHANSITAVLLFSVSPPLLLLN